MWKDSETEIDFLDYDYLIQTVQSIIELTHSNECGLFFI